MLGEGVQLGEGSRIGFGGCREVFRKESERTSGFLRSKV
jgi:hypothetical protein